MKYIDDWDRRKARHAKGDFIVGMMEKASISHGMLTPFTPSRNCTSGTNSTRIRRSLTETCTSVCAGSPFVRLLHTNTIAVHGATPSNTAPVTKSCASSAGMKARNMTLKNRAARPNMRKGLMSQLLPLEIRMPKACFPTFLMDWKSIFIIIG